MNDQYGKTKRHNKRIAAAVVGALAAAPVAFAQADVSIYGVADVAVSNIDWGQTGAKTFLTSDSGTGGSRLGFNASSDLGGGLTGKANIEAGYNAAGTGNYGTVTAGGVSFPTFFGMRQSWVGLDGGFGSIHAGQQYTLSFLAAFRGEYCGFCGIASPAALTQQGVRAKNELQYMSPDMGGLSVGLGHVFGGDPANSSNGDMNEGAVYYSKGDVNVAASYRTITGTPASTSEKMKDWYAAGNVGFGMVKVYALVGAAKTDSGSTDEQYTGVGVGFKVAGGDLNLHYHNTKGNAANTDSTLTAVSYFHPLSKATTVYGQYGSISNGSNVFRGGFPGQGVSPAGANGQTETGVQVGVKVAF